MNLLKPIALAFLLPFAHEQAQAYHPAHLVPEAQIIILNDSLNLESKLPFDQEVIHGTLDNGFQYYIRKNTEPENRVTMYLGVKVGSILETEQQLGLAHFLDRKSVV